MPCVLREPESRQLRERPDQHDGVEHRDDHGRPRATGPRLRRVRAERAVRVRLRELRHRRRVHGAGDVHGDGAVYADGSRAPNSGTTNVFECPVAGGTCIGIPFDVSGAGVSVASASPNPRRLRERSDQHDGDDVRDDQCRRGVQDGGCVGFGAECALRLRLRELRHRWRVHGAGDVHGDGAVYADGDRVGIRDDERVRVSCGGRDLYRYSVQRERQRCEPGVGESEPGELRQRPDQHDRVEHRDDHMSTPATGRRSRPGRG